MSWIVAIFFILVWGITCRTPHCNRLGSGVPSLFCFGKSLQRGSFLQLLLNLGGCLHPRSLYTSFDCLFSWHGMAVFRSPWGTPNPPMILFYPCPLPVMACVETVPHSGTGVLPQWEMCSGNILALFLASCAGIHQNAGVWSAVQGLLFACR